MIAALLLLCLGGPTGGAPGTIRVSCEGAPGAVEILAFRDGVVVARATGGPGPIELRGLADGACTLLARAEGFASEPEPGVRPVFDRAEGVDAVLALRPAARVEVRTARGAWIHWEGLRLPAEDLLLPCGLTTLLADDGERVSGAERLVRVGSGAAVELPLDPGMVVTGRVLLPGGAPAEGARIEVFADGAPTGRGGHARADGEFGVGGFRGDAISIRVAAPFAAEALRRVVFQPGEERARVEIALAAGSSAVVPTAGADAILLPRWYEDALEMRGRLRPQHLPERRSGGAFARFAGLVPGREYRVLFARAGFRARSTPWFVAPPAGRTLALEAPALPRAASIEGAVAGALPAPFGLVVACDSAEGTLLCRTDRAGRFRFEGLGAGPHALSVRDVDLLPRTVELQEGETRSVTLECADPGEGRSVSGLVIDADGRPLPAVRVETLGRTAVTDGNGEFLVDRIPRGPGEVTLALRPLPGCRAFAEDPHLPRLERRVRVGKGARVRLERAGLLRIDFETGGARLCRATLRAAGTSGTTIVRRLPRDARGVAIEDLPAGSYSVDVEIAGLLGTSGAIVRTGEPARLPVARGRSVTGRVLFRRAVEREGEERLVVDEPLPGATVALLDFARPSAVVTTDEEGAFELAGLPLAPVLLVAAVPGKPPAAARVDLALGDASGVVLALYDAVEAGVVVLDPEERPVEDARIRILHEEGAPLEELLLRARFLGAAGDDGDPADLARVFRIEHEEGGFYRAPFLAPGSWRFLVSREGFEEARAAVRAIDPLTVRMIEEAVPHALKDRSPKVRLKRR